MNAVAIDNSAPSYAPRARRAAPDPLTWAPPVSAPNFPRKVTLGSFYSQRAFREGFSRGQIACNQLLNYLPFVVTSEEFSEVHGIVKDKFAALEKEMADEIARLDAMLAAEGIDAGDREKSFTAPLTMIVPLYTVEAKRVLQLIERFDDLCWRIEVLRFNELIKPEARTQLHNRWKKALLTLPRELGDLWIRARNALRRKRAERNAPVTKAQAEGLAIPADIESALDSIDASMQEIVEGSDEALSPEAELDDALQGNAVSA